MLTNYQNLKSFRKPPQFFSEHFILLGLNNSLFYCFIYTFGVKKIASKYISFTEVIKKHKILKTVGGQYIDCQRTLFKEVQVRATICQGRVKNVITKVLSLIVTVTFIITLISGAADGDTAEKILCIFLAELLQLLKIIKLSRLDGIRLSYAFFG